MRLFPLLALSLRPAGRACALATLLAGATLLGGCQSDGLGLPGEEEAKDKETRLEYYETAALTYYDGGSYDRAEQMAERWLKESPGDKKALRVLARSKLNQGTPTKLREAERIETGQTLRVRDVIEAPDGAIWFVSEGNGAVYRMTPG